MTKCWVLALDMGMTPSAVRRFTKTAFPGYGFKPATKTYLKLFDDGHTEMEALENATRFPSKEEAEAKILWLIAQAPDMIGKLEPFEWDAP